ncbi:MAG: FecR domain-containing protein [Deltaproteobacteria bacterium]|nr:FecR domain-containing protein [Deltaproteobacteria bacterium]
MRKFAFLWTICMILAFQVGPLTNAQANVVGRLTQVEGRVDILRGGQLPATPVKVADGVETGDVLRTKSLSKAQITFIDNSTLTISPESRVAIEAYMFDSAQNKRNAVIQLFSGLAHVVVSKVFKSAEPDFVVKTQTAIMGVRGTDFGVRLQPNSSEILNFEGVLQVGNIFPEVSQLFRKAFKVAYSFGSGGEGGRWVFLKGMQGTSVGRGLPPTLPFTLSPEDRKAFMRQMVADLISRKGGGDTVGGAITDYAGSTGQQGSDTPGGPLGSLFASFFQTAFSNFTIYTPPPDRPPIGTPASNPNNPVIPPTYNFTLATYGGFLQSAAPLPVSITSAGFGVLQGDWGDALPRLYAATDSSSFTPSIGTFPNRKLGVYTTNIVGTVSGDLGSVLAGSATLNSSYTSLRYKLSNSATIQVTINSSGQITYSFIGGSFDGVVNSSAISGTSSGNGTAAPLKNLISEASTVGAAEPMMFAAESATAAPLANNNQLAATTGIPGVAGTAEAHRRSGLQSDSFRHKALGAKFAPAGGVTLETRKNLATLTGNRPMTGHLQGVGPGPTITNFALTSPITKFSSPLSQNIPGKGSRKGSMLGGAAGNPGSRHAGTAQGGTRPKGTPPQP